MKNIYKCLLTALLTGILIVPFNNRANAGNKDRSGQAGAAELLINPWARSAGWASANSSNVSGLEAQWGNVAGLARVNGSEVNFTHTNWLKGSDINIYSFGFAREIGESGAFAVSVMNMSFGDILVRTTDVPEGNGSKFSPSYMNINIAYAKEFSHSIYGGFNLKVITESISNLSATGFAIDAGIQYLTGPDDNIHFGITLKNVGPTMKFSGDGLSVRGYLDLDGDKNTFAARPNDMELPASLSIGAAYDFLFGEKQRFTLAGTFQSNSFTQDLYIIGGEYSYRDILMLRAGYAYEDGITSDVERSDRLTAETGLNFGASVQVPLSAAKGSSFAVDYAYSDTDNFNGTHRIAVKLNF